MNVTLSLSPKLVVISGLAFQKTAELDKVSCRGSAPPGGEHLPQEWMKFIKEAF